MNRIYLDTNAFIGAFERRGEVSDLIAQIIVGPPTGEVGYKIVTSELTIAEALVQPMRDKLYDVVDHYLGFLQPTDAVAGGMEVVPISRAILVRAAEMRAGRPSLKMPDAIHLATALETGCALAVSNDVRLSMGAIEIVSLTPSALMSLYERLTT